MMSKFISIGLIAAVMSSSLIYASDIEDFEEIDSKRKVELHEHFPKQLAAAQIQQLAQKQSAPCQLDYARFTLDEQNAAKLQSTIPYNWQIVTGTWPKFAANIHKVDGSERRVDASKLVATYRFTSPYAVRNNVEFDVTLEGKTYKLIDSVLGDKDFVSKPTQPIKDASFFYIGYTNEQFVRQTKLPARLNENMKSWLLILAQLHGENIYTIDESAREIRAQTLFDAFLSKKEYKLNGEGILSMDEYVDCMNYLQCEILGTYNLKVTDIPSHISGDQTIELVEGKLVVKARVGE
jgi:hypothetical protein